MDTPTLVWHDAGERFPALVGNETAVYIFMYLSDQHDPAHIVYNRLRADDSAVYCGKCAALHAYHGYAPYLKIVAVPIDEDDAARFGCYECGEYFVNCNGGRIEDDGIVAL